MQASLMNQLDNISTVRSILFLLHIEKVLFARSFFFPAMVSCCTTLAKKRSLPPNNVRVVYYTMMQYGCLVYDTVTNDVP